MTFYGNRSWENNFPRINLRFNMMLLQTIKLSLNKRSSILHGLIIVIGAVRSDDIHDFTIIYNWQEMGRRKWIYRSRRRLWFTGFS